MQYVLLFFFIFFYFLSFFLFFAEDLTGYKFNSLYRRMALLSFIEEYPRFEGAPVSPTDLNLNRNWLESLFEQDNDEKVYWQQREDPAAFSEMFTKMLGKRALNHADHVSKLGSVDLQLYNGTAAPATKKSKPAPARAAAADAGHADSHDDDNSGEHDDQAPRKAATRRAARKTNAPRKAKKSYAAAAEELDEAMAKGVDTISFVSTLSDN